MLVDEPVFYPSLTNIRCFFLAGASAGSELIQLPDLLGTCLLLFNVSVKAFLMTL